MFSKMIIYFDDVEEEILEDFCEELSEDVKLEDAFLCVDGIMIDGISSNEVQKILDKLHNAEDEGRLSAEGVKIF